MKKRPRTERRARERDVRAVVRDRERLALLAPGGAADHPLTIDSPAVIEPRLRAMKCPQCDGELAMRDHRAAGAGLREVDVICQRCHAPRTLYFRLGTTALN